MKKQILLGVLHGRSDPVHRRAAMNRIAVQRPEAYEFSGN
jgi:hypothetical protein